MPNGVTDLANRATNGNQARSPTPAPIVRTPRDAERDVRDIYESRRRRLLRELRAQTAAAQRELEARIPDIERRARGERRQVDIGSIQAADRLRGMLAEQGLLRGGAGVTAQAGLQAQRGQLLADVGAREAGAIGDIEAQIARLGQQEALQQQAALAGLGAEEAEALLGQRIRAEDIARQEAIRQEQIAREQPVRDIQLQQAQQALEEGRIRLEQLPQDLQMQLALRNLQVQQAERELRRPFFRPTSAVEQQIQQEQLRRLQLQNVGLEQEVQPQRAGLDPVQDFNYLSTSLRETRGELQREGASPEEIDRTLLQILETASFTGTSDDVILRLLNQYGLQ